ncbi:nucleotidyl transferase AbiEii/AbiGii toxin family protein [Actinoplanes rectilineatus]|uniref:nucleotidyl transferase AbiEii/AbiGii toxin family protein n=1 Tax=Actinoplanes rectilineatus TaxID=113571 RepID=UPI0005F296CC|nr:nucleotidyl transferase AbiEii/AbiGii toxin family protein [Actinoplanes rectilineatus]
MIHGDFETHITVAAGQADGLELFAERYGVTFLCIELDRGDHRFQPMLTLHGSGSLDEQEATAAQWCDWLRSAGLHPVRTKIEATPWADGVPVSDQDAEPGRYFEHHVKLRLPSVAADDLLPIADLAETHGARLSRNARRTETDGTHQRFVNQRCHGVGRATATLRLESLLTTLRYAGHEPVSVEQEYVVVDSRLDLDEGWLVARPFVYPHEKRGLEDLARIRQARQTLSGDRSFPPTYQPLARGRGVVQSGAFDPAVKQFPNAYIAGEPVFADPAVGHAWQLSRTAAMAHVLAVIAGSPWVEQLVLRGSVTMASWVGEAARRPGDLDFVVVPPETAADGPLVGEIAALITANPGAGLRPQDMTRSAIWAYERAEGRRLVIPFGGDGIPDGTVQIDLVFGEPLPIPPAPLEVLGSTVPAATAELSLAWKLLWLATDMYSQGKDLYDAVLLAEHNTVDLDLVRELMRPELGDEADDFTPATVLTWDFVDWENFADEYPGVTGTAAQWLRRLAVALDRPSR